MATLMADVIGIIDAFRLQPFWPRLQVASTKR